MVPDYEKRPEVQSQIYGKMAAISGMGITVGPIIGGHIADDYSNGFMYIGIAVGVCFFINAGNFKKIILYISINTYQS